MKTIVGVMGPGAKDANPEDIACAFEVGKIVARLSCVLLCGGMTGVMEAAAKGTQDAGGLTVGIGPTLEKADMNKYIDVPIVTGMHGARNFMNVLSSDLVVFVNVGSPGTLSELAFALQLGKPSLIVGGSDELKAYLATFENVALHFADSVSNLESKMKTLVPV